MYFEESVLSLSLRALESFSTESVWWELWSMSSVCILLSRYLHTWRPRVFSTETLWNCFVSPTPPHALFLSLSDLSLNQPFLTKHQLIFHNICCIYLSPFYYSRQFFSSATTSKCHGSSGNSVSPCVMMDCPNACASPYSPEMKLVCYYKVIISW